MEIYLVYHNEIEYCVFTVTLEDAKEKVEVLSNETKTNIVEWKVMKVKEGVKFSSTKHCCDSDSSDEEAVKKVEVSSNETKEGIKLSSTKNYYDCSKDEDYNYRSEDEWSTSHGSDEESEYEGNDEYYQGDADGGYFLYCDDFLMKIPGYALFCADHNTLDRNELNILWKKLKEENHNKYHKYIEKYKEEHPREFYSYRRNYSKGDPCLYKK